MKVISIIVELLVKQLIKRKLSYFSALMLTKATLDTDFKETYLGLPLFVRKSKGISFSSLKDRIWKRLINGWKEKFLSVARKEFLIKAVAQAIPTYHMSCFQLPRGLCDETNKLIRNFW